MSQAKDVLLIGSMPMKDNKTAQEPGKPEMASEQNRSMDAAGVFEVVAERLGELAPYIPDGDQAGWAPAVFMTLPGHPAIELVEMVPLHDKTDWKIPLFAIKDDVDRSTVTFGPYGFADAAKESYADFVRLREAGKIPAGTRLNVTLPTPATGMLSMLEPWDSLLPIAEAAMIKELEGILAVVPAEDLTIQWDVAGEVAGEEWLRHPEAANLPYLEKHAPAPFDTAIASLARVSDAVPEPVVLGIHLCYGSPDGRHVIEPHDGTVLKDFCNALAKQVKRKIDYIHMPVPIERDDEAFWAPFKELEIDPETKIYLGLIHLGDGVEGAKRRMAAAERVIPEFGVGAECGFSSIPYESLNSLLDLHREVATVGS